MMELTGPDREQLKEKGISEEEVRKQINTFKAGIPFAKLVRAATVGDGIFSFPIHEEEHYLERYYDGLESTELLKFVPASGAASRMFKALFNFLDVYNPDAESLQAYLDRTGDTAMAQFFEGIKDFPFYNEVKSAIAGKTDSPDKEAYLFVEELLSEDGLNYGFYPKGLLPFHTYGDLTATPFEEHLFEADAYACSGDRAQLHFTISPQHTEMFAEEYTKASAKLGQFSETHFEVTYSQQKPATDTIAVDMENKPFRNSDGSLLFRPGGHGALIENLNEQDADIIFVKNIDNVVPRSQLKVVERYKKILAGLLLELQGKMFQYAAAMEKGPLAEDKIGEVQSFLTQQLGVNFSQGFEALDADEKQKVLWASINKPIRICGMVKNEGEPGGGPFWVADAAGNITLQIIEGAQIDMGNSEQAGILQNATHFNPVDLVCGVRNYKGQKYDLLQFVDTKQGFITEKTKEGKQLKALERPGLWNGAMAFWNTVFVEVPLATFNPVKTVNDLLKPGHQAS